MGLLQHFYPKLDFMKDSLNHMIICVNFLSDPFVDFLFNDNFLYYFKSLFAKFILYLDYSLNIFVFRISLEWLLLPNLRRC